MITGTVVQAFTATHPIYAGVGLLAAAGLFRLVDIFVLRLDERWGEIILSKAVAVLILLAFLVANGVGLAAAGFQTRAVIPSIGLGVGLTIIALAVGYGVEFAAQARRGRAPVFTLAAIDPKTGLAGAVGFAVFLLAGNLINSFAEEGLFRGVLIPLFFRETGLWTALLVSAVLFGVWHLPWAVKAILAKDTDSTPSAWHLAANFVPQTVLGVVWGYLYIRTGNLWGAWAAHTLANSAINCVHVRSADGMDTGLSVRMIIFMVLMLMSLVVIQWVSQAYHLPVVAPWGA